MVSGVRGSPWSQLVGQQLLVWEEIQQLEVAPMLETGLSLLGRRGKPDVLLQNILCGAQGC